MTPYENSKLSIQKKRPLGKHSHVWDGGFEDVQHTVAGLVPGLSIKLLTIKDDHVFKAISA